MKQLSTSQNMRLGALMKQARWFDGFFRRCADRIIDEPANDREERPEPTEWR